MALAAVPAAPFFSPRAPLSPAERLARTEGALADLVRRVKRAGKRGQPVAHLTPLIAKFEREAAALRAHVALMAASPPEP